MIDNKTLPTHVALIMDGNGRWAKKKFLPRIMGHRSGMRSMEKVVMRANELGIKYITLYAFSTENWKRSAEEVKGIFDLLVEFASKEGEKLNINNVKIHVLGKIDGIPDKAKEALLEAVDNTKNNTGVVLNLAVNYGSRDEIVMATRNIITNVLEGKIKLEDIDENTISKNLYTGINNIPDPDLIIRTSGEERISNYLLWQIAYSEFVFTDTLWPDFDGDELEKCVKIFQKRDRRFGERK